MAFRLSVNLNKIALVRNSREGNYPNVTAFAELFLNAGAQGLTAHPRPDQRHMRPSDIRELSAVAKAHDVEFNIEGNPFARPKAEYPGLLHLVETYHPEQCTLVPDSDSQLTSDHGFDLNRDGDRLQKLIEQLKDSGTRVSLFMDPDVEQIKLAQECGADAIELYTGPFAWAFNESIANTVVQENKVDELFKLHVNAAKAAQKLELGINAGHDLNLSNLKIYKDLPGLQEVSIGHALTVDALLMGYENALKKYLELCS